MTRPDAIVQGRPHEPRTRKLMEEFGQERGTRVSHEQIESVIGEARGTGKYSGVIQSWRRRLLNECGVHLISVPNEGYEFASAQDQVRSGANLIQQAKRRAIKSAKVIAAAPDAELTEEQRRAKLHSLGIASSMLTQIQQQTRDLPALMAALQPGRKA